MNIYYIKYLNDQCLALRNTYTSRYCTNYLETPDALFIKKPHTS